MHVSERASMRVQTYIYNLAMQAWEMRCSGTYVFYISLGDRGFELEHYDMEDWHFGDCFLWVVVC